MKAMLTLIGLTLGTLTLAELPSGFADDTLPILEVDTKHLPERIRKAWRSVELKGRLMTGAAVANLFPSAPDPLASSSDVYFVGYTTFLDDIDGRLLHAQVDVYSDEFGLGVIDLVRAGNFARGSREFCIQIWHASDSLSPLGQPVGIERPLGMDLDYDSKSKMATAAANSSIAVRLRKMFLK